MSMLSLTAYVDQSTWNLNIIAHTILALSDQIQGHGDFEMFLHLPQYKLLSPISQLWHMIESCFEAYVFI